MSAGLFFETSIAMFSFLIEDELLTAEEQFEEVELMFGFEVVSQVLEDSGTLHDEFEGFCEVIAVLLTFDV